MMDKNNIDEHRQQIVKLIAQLESKERKSDYEDVGSTSDDEASEFEEFEENVALSGIAKKQLKELRAALVRINEGKYGKCERCQAVIEAARLKEFPAARFCSSHAK